MAEAERHPHTVLLTNNPKAAEAVVEFLATKNIPAEVHSAAPRAESDPLLGMTSLVQPGEFEIRVTDETRVDEAKTLLEDLQQIAKFRAIREQREQRTGTVTATCEECGQSSEWEAAAMGTTETCPHCSAYMDIPDPEDDAWSDVDFGDPEEEGEPEA